MRYAIAALVLGVNAILIESGLLARWSIVLTGVCAAAVFATEQFTRRERRKLARWFLTGEDDG